MIDITQVIIEVMRRVDLDPYPSQNIMTSSRVVGTIVENRDLKNLQLKVAHGLVKYITVSPDSLLHALTLLYDTTVIPMGETRTKVLWNQLFWKE